MSVTEYGRHQICQWYEEAMGSERAAIMMNLVPRVGWGGARWPPVPTSLPSAWA